MITPQQWLPLLLASQGNTQLVGQGHTQRFLVLTTQHSGSTWFNAELNAQRGVACAGELLIDLDEHLLPHNGSHQVQACLGLGFGFGLSRARCAFLARCAPAGHYAALVRDCPGGASRAQVPRARAVDEPHRHAGPLGAGRRAGCHRRHCGYTPENPVA